MWETLAKIFPPPLLAGLLIYAGVCFLWLQPLIEERMANITYIPQCKAGNLPVVATPPLPLARKTLPGGVQVPKMPRMELPLSVQIIAELKGLFRQQGGQYTVTPGIVGEPCACSVAVAFDSVFWRSLIHVMSLRTYTPRAIRDFDTRIAKTLASGVCGKK